MKKFLLLLGALLLCGTAAQAQPLFVGGTGVVGGVDGNCLIVNGSVLGQVACSGGGGSGTVTSASVVSANGFAGTVATPTTTPAITLTTPISGLLKGNGTAMSAAVAGTDYVAPSGLGTGVATLLSGPSSGTGGPAGTVSPTFTGTVTLPNSSLGAVTSITGAGIMQWASRGILSSPAAGTLQLGAANAASPIAQTINAQGSRVGTDSNVAGAPLTIASGIGTGTATPTTISFKSPVAVASGTGAQTLATGLTVNAGTYAGSGYTVSTLPAAPGVGARAHVTDATACTFGGALTGSGSTFCPVIFNGTAWIGG